MFSKTYHILFKQDLLEEPFEQKRILQKAIIQDIQLNQKTSISIEGTGKQVNTPLTFERLRILK